MHLDQLFHERETDSESAARAIHIVANLSEQIKNPREHIEGYANAIVGDRDDDLVAFASRRKNDRCRPPEYISPHC